MATVSHEGETRATGILVVDDNPRNLLAIDAALAGFDGGVVKASGGEDALRALLRQDFAVILLDVQMPGMDGFETARLIRTRDRCKSTPIIFVTAFDQNRRDVLRGYELGAADFLFKPIVPEILRAKVAVFVELRRQMEEIARQQELLRAHERREQEALLEDAKRRWEAAALRKAAAESQERADQLALTVAERERAQIELTRANRELEAADRKKNEFLAVLAHELRTPLSPIMLGVDLLKQGTAPDAQAGPVLEAMGRQGAHLVRLVDDLLEMSRITRGKITLRTEPFRLNDAVEQAASMCASLLDEREQSLQLQLCPEDVVVDGDRVRLTQVIVNLLSNASRYTPKGGSVCIVADRSETEVRMRITDSGCGMAPDLIERVFDLFVQGSTDEMGGGLGIGLSLVKKLVELHGGQVSAESPGLNQGSTFTVRLPIVAKADPQRPRPDSPAKPPEPSVKPLKVLLVEDDDDIRDLTHAMLQKAGHAVTSADSGRAAIDCAAAHEFDIALVDIGLPDMRGVEVGSGLRRLLGPRVHIVAVTGYGQSEVRDEAASAGFDAFLVKPVEKRELTEQLKTAADKHANAATADHEVCEA